MKPLKKRINEASEQAQEFAKMKMAQFMYGNGHTFESLSDYFELPIEKIKELINPHK